MPKPEAVVFDLGKVLLDFDYTIAARRLGVLGQVPSDAIQRTIDQSPLLHQYEAGQLSTPDFFARIAAETGYAGKAQEFAEAFGDIFTPIEGMVALHGDLVDRGVPTFLLSNTNELAIQHVRQRFPFFHRFQGHALSYELRCLKPEAAIYEAVERLSGRKGPQLFYLDDRPDYVNAARQRGWQAETHTDPARSRRYLVDLGLV